MKKTEVLSIVENNFEIPEGKSIEKLTPIIENNLGSSDTDIRENSLEILWNWITTEKYNSNELVNIGERMVANLAKGLGESGTDSVFLRSFSALILGGVIRTDIDYSSKEKPDKESYISSEKMNDWLNRSITSFLAEDDLRGYVETKKWSHSIAHFGDLFVNFSLNPKMEKKDLIAILDAIAERFTKESNQVMNAYEDGRLCRTVITIWSRKLISVKDFKIWLSKFSQPFVGPRWFDDNIAFERSFNYKLNARVNTRLFLDMLYFMIKFGYRQTGNIPIGHKENLGNSSEQLLELIANAISTFDDNSFLYKEKA